MSVEPEKNNPKELFAWCVYDWANSVYPLVIATAIFPIYYATVVPLEVDWMGVTMNRVSLRSYAISFSYLLIVLLVPIMSGVADFKNWKKGFLMLACYSGALSCGGLYFFTSETLTLGIILFIISSFCFAMSDSFYNAFLPDIATADRFDGLSARGFSLGYIGSSILLLLALILVFSSDVFGVSKGVGTRLGFVLTAIWWAGFGTFTFLRLKERKNNTFPTGNMFGQGFQELWICLKELAKKPILSRFLLTFLFYDMGLQTVMFMATDFGAEELKLSTEPLIIALLLIQLIGAPGAYCFALLSKKKGNIFALKILVIIWIAICSYAYFIKTDIEFYVLGAVVGCVMGGMQSVSRATYSKLLPQNHPGNASFFSFYSVTDKVAIVGGTLIFGLMNQLTGSMRASVLFLISFFIIGLALLIFNRWDNKLIKG